MPTKPVNPPDDCPDDLIPTRRSLLGRLKDWQDNASWQEFFDTYWRLIYNFSRQRGLDHEEAQEVVQDTVVAVAKSIDRFRYEPGTCRFKTWLLTVTRSKIANQFARRGRPSAAVVAPADDSAVTPLLHRVPAREEDPLEATWDEEWRRNLMEVAIQRVKRRVSIEQYQMFDFFVLKHWPARDVARTLGVTVAHVYVAKHRVSKLVRREIAALEAQEE